MLCLSMLSVYPDHQHTRLSGYTCQRSPECPHEHSSDGIFLRNYFATIFKEALELNLNLLSLDSVKVLVGVTPFYIATRFIDERIQKRFYDPNCHKNINQMPSTFCRVVEESAFGILIGFSSMAILAPSAETRLVARVFGIGGISALLGKKLVKEFKFHGGRRPWHEKFSSKKRAYGGFPSGHMVEAAYSATVLGWQYGYKAAVPLGIFAGLMFGVSVNRNRHYVSQVVAGTAVGIIYGIAANRVIDRKLCSDFSFQVGTGTNGGSELTVSYKF